MKTHNDEAALVDIIGAARHVREFCRAFDRAALSRDVKTLSAVLHQLVVLGEAVKRLSPEFRDQHEEIDWRGAAGTRDKVIHHYDRVDLHELWKIISEEIPDLLSKLEPLQPPRRDED